MVACICSVSVVELLWILVLFFVVVEIFDLFVLTIFVFTFFYFSHFSLLQTNQNFGTLKLSSLCTSVL